MANPLAMSRTNRNIQRQNKPDMATVPKPGSRVEREQQGVRANTLQQGVRAANTLNPLSAKSHEIKLDTSSQQSVDKRGMFKKIRDAFSNMPKTFGFEGNALKGTAFAGMLASPFGLAVIATAVPVITASTTVLFGMAGVAALGMLAYALYSSSK